MQFTAVASPRGTVVLDTQPVPVTLDANDVAPLRVIRHSVDDTRSVSSLPARDVCVFDPDSSGPVRCQAEVRMQGVFLQQAICVALRRDRHTSRCNRVVSTLPSLPQEQYTLSSTLRHWSDICVPVDLRPLGGGISVHYFPCTATGTEVLTHAATAQRLPLPADVCCQTGSNVMHPAAQLLLTNAGDTVRGLLRADLALQAHSTSEAATPVPLAPPSSAQSVRTVAVLYQGGILLHDVDGAAPTDTDRARTMRAIRGELGLQDPVFLRPQMHLADLPTTQLVALELEDVECSVLVDMRNIGGSISFASILPGASTQTCLLEADLPPTDWSIHQAIPAMLRAGWLRVHDSMSLAQHLPSRQGVRVITVVWKQIPTDTPPEQEEVCLAPAMPSGTSRMAVLPYWWLLPLIISKGQIRSLSVIGWGLLSLAAVQGHPDDMWLSPTADVGSTIFRGTSELASIADHHQYATMLHLQPAAALPPTHLIVGPTWRTNPTICVQIWAPEHTQQFTLPAEEVAEQLQHRLRLTDPSGQRRVPALVMPQLEWPCIQFVAPSKDPELVTILVDVGHSLFCLDVTRSRLAADLFQQLRSKCGHEEFRINRGLVASVRHGELLRVFAETVSRVHEIGRISMKPHLPPSAMWLGHDEQVYVVGPFLELVGISASHAVQETDLLRWLYLHYGVDGTLHRIPQLPGGYTFSAPLYCLSPPAMSCHVVLVTDALGHWQRFAVQASTYTSSPGDAVDDLATSEGPYQNFWQQVRNSLPVLYTIPATTSNQPAVSLLVIDALRAFQFGLSFTHHNEPEVVQTSGTVIPADQRAIGTQTAPSFWPASATAVSSSAVPQLPAVRSCIPLPQLCPDGPYVQLDCPRFQVQCLLPCLPGYHPWGLRIGLAVFGVCTTEVTWQHVLTIAEANPWDLSGEIMGDTELWTWPEDVSGLAGQCGHLLQSGSDPFLCAAGAKRAPFIRHDVPGPNNTVLTAGSTSAACSVNWPRLGVVTAMGALFGLHGTPTVSGSASFLLLWGAVFAFQPVTCSPDRNTSYQDDDCSLSPLVNNTRTCTVAWGHELSCQTNTFAVLPVDVLAYIRQVSPEHLVRVQLWLPYRGPAAFEFHRDVDVSHFEQLLQVAGHQTGHVISVAYDTLGTSLDLLSTPNSPATWWIVRDGLNRELLRPVTLWLEPGARYVVSINSHGQAQALSCTPEVARLNRLPQGVRATVTLPLSRTTGQMTANGLVLYEVALGVLSGAMPPRLRPMIIVLYVLGMAYPATAMQNTLAPQELAVQARNYAVPNEPAISRIWTYSCDAPVEVPFVYTPDLTRMLRQIEGTGRGIPPHGDFVWTSPRIVQGRAHILHFPPRTSPPYVFWLLHYRARGHVVAASDQAFDWALVGALAADAFGEPWFGQGAFGIVQQNRVIQYGEAIGIPPHGAIIHLVRTSLQPRLGYTGWDAPADAGCILPFDYDICLGARGGPPIVLDPHDMPSRTATAAARLGYIGRTTEQDNQYQSRQLERQIAEVGNDLQVLITRLETAGVLPAPEVAPWTTEAGTSDNPEQPTNSFAPQHRPSSAVIVAASFLLSLAHSGPRTAGTWYLLIGLATWQHIGAQAQDHDESSSAEGEMSEPSSPSLLEGISAPTPLTTLAEVPGESPVVLPSADPSAVTGVPEQNSLPASSPQGPPLSICTVQHRFSCAIRGHRISAPVGEPFIPAGIPVIMHNPFTGRPQCRLRTTAQGSPQILCNTLADYAARRGWQPLVDVQPQPNDEAVHLIPSAERQDLTSILLLAEGEPHPMCVPRTFPSRGSRKFRFGNREGRVVAPFPSRRISQGPLQLRDGDCLPVNFGPFGPPPPEPARSFGHHRTFWGLVSVGLVLPRWTGLLLSCLMLAGRGVDGQVVDGLEAKPIYRISAFPWRQPYRARTLSSVCAGRQCRVTMLCPWTGQQGLYTVDAHTPFEEICDRYRASLPGWPDQQYIPTWPGLRHDRLTLIPATPSHDMACIVVKHTYNSRAIIVPASISDEQLSSAIRHLTPWQPHEVRYPPAVRVARLKAPTMPVSLRSGDVLEILEPQDRPQAIAFQFQDHLRGYAMWTQGVGVLCTMLVRLWDTDWPRPIVTWLTPGVEWLPDLLTFSGSFQDSYPGQWIPVAWGLSKILQLVRASTHVHRVNVLVEQEDRTFVTSLPPDTNSESIAASLQSRRDYIQVLGVSPTRECPPCRLRDGDIITSHGPWGSNDPIYGWPDDDNGDMGPTIAISVAAALTGASKWLPALVVLLHAVPAGAVRSSQPDRSRSPSRASDTSSCGSPRPYRWRPDQAQPFQDVASRWFDYSVLCPFQGWSQGARCLRETSGDTIQAVMLQWCQQWAPSYTLLGGLEPQGSAIVIPGGLARLATVLVFTPGALTAHLVPRVISFRRIHTFLRRLVAGSIRIRLPPSLRVSEHGPDADVILRDGDAFEAYHDASYTSFRPGQQVPTVPFSHLPHHYAWHLPFRVAQGGWVRIWSSDFREGRASEKIWVAKGSVWAPHWCQFQPPGTLPGPDRWVPAAGAENDCCHFVRQSDLGQAQVLLHSPGTSTTLRCVRCPSAGGEQSYPHGWRLRADLAARSSILHLRDGDVMVPGPGASRRRVQFRTMPSIAVLAIGSSKGYLLSALLVASNSLHWGVLGTPVPPPPSLSSGSCKVGKYDWRIPAPSRLCNLAAAPGASACVMSPFTGRSEAVPVDPDTSYEHLADTFLGTGPIILCRSGQRSLHMCLHSQWNLLIPVLWSSLLCHRTGKLLFSSPGVLTHNGFSVFSAALPTTRSFGCVLLSALMLKEQVIVMPLIGAQAMSSSRSPVKTFSTAYLRLSSPMAHMCGIEPSGLWTSESAAP